MNRKNRILLVDDEEGILDAVKLNLEMDQYEVETARDGKEAIDKYSKERFDIILLDVMMPDISGLDVCKQIRLVDRDIPIIFLTAKNQTKDKIIGLKGGADDYLTKPFSMEELSVRIDNLIRRSSVANKTKSEEYAFGSNSINFQTYQARNMHGEIDLTQKETLLLKLLIDNKNEVVSRKSILQNVWGYDVYPSTRTIDNFIVTLRKYFERNPREPEYFISIRGVGYKFVDNR